jgi:peptidyl-prolyl cis-trans isomerase C
MILGQLLRPSPPLIVCFHRQKPDNSAPLFSGKHMISNKLFVALLALTGFASGARAGDDVEIVKQGDAAVTLTDVEGFLQQMPEDQRKDFLGDPTRAQQMLIGILRDKQMANQALAMKLDQDPLVQAGIAYQRNRMLSTARMSAFLAALKVPSMEAAAKEQYLAHKAEYMKPEVVDVQHILITAKGRTDADAKALAEKVRAEAVANPGGFDELVQKYSEDPSKVNNKGQIRDATSNKLVGEFREAAKKLTTVGEISPVTKTSYGYHVLKLISRVPPQQQDFDAVKNQLMAKLKADYIEEQRTAFLAKLDESTPSVNPQGIDALRERYKLDASNIGEAIKAEQAKKAAEPDKK